MVKSNAALKDRSFFDIIRPQLFTIFKYSIGYMLAIFYYEILLAFQYGISDLSFYFVFFIPAQGTFLALLNGWFKKKKINSIIYPVVMGILFIYYVSQLIYYKIFQSMYSVYMMGQGAEAAGNFSGGLFEVIIASFWEIVLFLIPVILSVIFAVISFKKKKAFRLGKIWRNLLNTIGFKPSKKPSRFILIVKYVLAYIFSKKQYKKYAPATHAVGFLQTVVLWCLAVLMLVVCGTGRASAFEAYSSATTTTDTGFRRLGVLTNFLVELGGADEEDISIDISGGDINIEQGVTPTPSTSPNIISKIDFSKLSNLTTDKDKLELCNYFANVKPTNKNEYTGKLQGYNLIYICAESFSSYAIDKELTPTLYMMSQGGVVLNNYYNSFKNTTTNGEFAFLTGLWPDVSRVANKGSDVGSFPQSKNKAFPYSFANLFEAEGASTYAYHNFRGSYYSRRDSHGNLGYDKMRFMDGEDRMRFTDSWPSSDLQMIEQSVDDYINASRFHTYYMTFSGHGPYSSSNNIAQKNLKYVKEVVKERNLPADAEYYLAANYELEKAMTELLKRLEAAGKLDKTLIVISGDHYPYYLGSRSYNALAGETIDTTFGIYKSSCIMWCGGMPAVQVDAPCSNVDIMPTVLNLLGMEYDSRLLPGVDVLSDSVHLAILSDNSFITDKVKYDAYRDKAEWLPSSAGMTDAEKSKYIDDYLAYIENRKNVSVKLMREDFYRFIVENTK